MESRSGWGRWGNREMRGHKGVRVERGGGRWKLMEVEDEER